MVEGDDVSEVMTIPHRHHHHHYSGPQVTANINTNTNINSLIILMWPLSILILPLLQLILTIKKERKIKKENDKQQYFFPPLFSFKVTRGQRLQPNVTPIFNILPFFQVSSGPLSGIPLLLMVTSDDLSLLQR